MSTQNSDDDRPIEDSADVSNPEEYGSLTIEDDPDGTTDPAELAGTATEDDADVS